jgi:hypothetical protein
MMKKLQIPIEEELMKDLKHLALKKDTTLKELVTTILKEATEQ